MADLRIVDAPLLSTVKGTEKLPTGGEGNFSVSVNQVADFAKLKWFLATEGYVDNAVGNVQADLNLHKNNESNPHNVTKVQVGLGNVDNTADLDKPVSNATQSAIITANSGKADKSYVDSQDQLKADKVYVDTQLNLKSNKADVETSLSLKANKTDLTASKIASDGGQTQQDINDFGGAKWYDKPDGYPIYAEVVLSDGNRVYSTAPNNTTDPNIDMTNWTLLKDSQIKTWSGRTQESKNKDVISLLDFNAPYSTNSSAHLQAALNYLSVQGGGVLHIPYHTGRLVLSGAISLRENVSVVADENLIIDCKGLVTGYQFTSTGSAGSEINTAANLTTGDSTITTITPHGLQVGDFVLLKSQRECAHTDAGAWRLGETTESASSPFFAEPLQVYSVPDAYTFTTYSGIIFPDYRIDKTLETSTTARARSTIQKLNFVKGISWSGGIFEKQSGNLFRTEYMFRPYIKVSFKRGYGTGIDIYNHKSYGSIIRSNTERPDDWALNGIDHSSFNSVKDVSAWFTDAIHVERNGSQGLDQTYTDICGLFPRYNITHYDSHEDGATTHGCCYGAVINVYAVNCKISAFRSRAPFSTIRVNAMNCRSGVIASTWGAVDCDFDITAINVVLYGLQINNTGVTATAQPFKNTRIRGRIKGVNKATTGGVIVEAYTDAVTTDSGLTVTDLNVSGCSRAVRTGTGINGVTLNNITVSDVGTAQPFYLQGSSGHKVSNIHCDLSNQDGTGDAFLIGNISGSSSIAAYGTTASNFDYNTIKVINGKLMSDDIDILCMRTTLTGVVGTNASLTLNNKNLSPAHYVTIAGNESAGNCRIVLDNSLPIGQKIDIYLLASAVLTNNNVGFYALNSGTIRWIGSKTKWTTLSFVNVSEFTKVTVMKIDVNTFVVEVP